MAKREQKGGVVRLGEEAYEKLKDFKGDKSWNGLILDLLDRLEAKVYWLIPSEKKVFEKKKDALGFSVLKAVQSGKAEPEKPIRVREDA